ncbi:MAG: sigma-70 family RNA polymerase sigma factor [Saprospiraceae bacterium]|nr:sigma-70 family RNA polymerase sigma factor [Saprospiraceae bacterium]
MKQLKLKLRMRTNKPQQKVVEKPILPSDEELVKEYQRSGNKCALGEIYNRYFQRVYQYCLGIIKERELAFDTAQDIFIKVSEKLHALHQPTTFVAWLFRIAHNQCIDVLKLVHRTETVVIDDRQDWAYSEADEEKLMQDDRLLSRMQDVLKTMPKEVSELLEAKYLSDKTIEELRHQYGLSESAVKMRLHRAKKKIEQALRVSAYQ